MFCDEHKISWRGVRYNRIGEGGGSGKAPAENRVQPASVTAIFASIWGKLKQRPVYFRQKHQSDIIEILRDESVFPSVRQRDVLKNLQNRERISSLPIGNCGLKDQAD